MDPKLAKKTVAFFDMMTSNDDEKYVGLTSRQNENILCPWIEIRPSKHGRGLFATRDIYRGDYITFYPIHQLGRRVEGDTWATRSHPDATQVYFDYALNINDNTRIIGDPNLIHNSMFLGHMINDPALDIEEKDPLQFIVRYFISCKARGNAAFDRFQEPWVGIRAVRDIRKDEEILVPYSLPYWSTRVGIKMEEFDAAILHYTNTAPIQKAKFLVELIEEISNTFQ